MTTPDKADSITINEKPNSVFFGKCATRYGSKNMYSEIISNGNNNPTKITSARMTNNGFVKTSLKTDPI